MAKKKKEKIVYYDDDSTLFDMSEVGRNRKSGNGNKTSSQYPKSGFKEKWNTYWSSVKLMLFPLCIVLAVILILYIVVVLITGNAR